MDILERIRTDLGTGPLSRIDTAAQEAGISRWTLLKVARGKSPNPRHKLLAAMQAYYTKKETAHG